MNYCDTLDCVRLYQFIVASSVLSESVLFMQALTDKEERKALTKFHSFKPNMSTWDPDEREHWTLLGIVTPYKYIVVHGCADVVTATNKLEELYSDSLELDCEWEVEDTRIGRIEYEDRKLAMSMARGKQG